MRKSLTTVTLVLTAVFGLSVAANACGQPPKKTVESCKPVFDKHGNREYVHNHAVYKDEHGKPCVPVTLNL